MQARERILRTLRGESIQAVPWSCYYGLLPIGQTERSLRAQGMAIIQPVTPYTKRAPHVDVLERYTYEAGERVLYRTLSTPIGSVTEKRRFEPGYGSSWADEHFIKRREDYPIMEFVIRDTVLEPDYEAALRVEEDLAGDGLALAWTTRSPYQMMYIELMGIERLAMDRADNLAEFLSLRQALEELDERIYALVAEAPVQLVWCPDNLSDLIAGGPVFEAYYAPYYDQRAKLLADAGKIMVTHMDGRLGGLVQAIARTALPVIEAFTPPPMGNVSVSQAKQAWPGKVLWVNFPGCLFLEPEEEIERYTVQLLEEGMPGGGFILGITENIPHSVRHRALRALARGVAKFEAACF